MYKLLFTAIIVYFAYKLMFAPKKIDQLSKQEHLFKKKPDDSEFVDYEEVD